MKRICATVFLAGLPLLVAAHEFTKDFAVVLATEKTEKIVGPMPLDRALLAKAIENAARYGAKGVVLKFFLDRARNSESDARLAQSMSLLPVVLQARLDDAEKNPNPLPPRFTLEGATYPTAVQGRSGWIPMPAFADRSRDICFVDFSASPVPLLETYNGKTVKSLLLCAVELAAGKQMKLVSGSHVEVGSFSARLDNLNQTAVRYPAANALEVFELSDLLDQKLPKNALKGRVVIIGYDGPNIHTVPTPFGTLGAHRAFILLLKSFYESGR